MEDKINNPNWRLWLTALGERGGGGAVPKGGAACEAENRRGWAERDPTPVTADREIKSCVCALTRTHNHTLKGGGGEARPQVLVSDLEVYSGAK